MANFSNAKFAFGRKAQSNKDTPDYTDMVRYPIMYNGGFDVTPEVDVYGDIVENQFESSLTSILGATVRGAVQMPASADNLALMLASMFGTVNSTGIGVGQTFTVNASTNIATANGHGLSIGQKVRFTTTTTLPDPLALLTTYYVGNLTANTFQIFGSYNNAINNTSAVDFTDTGTGTHTMTPQVFSHAITPSSSGTPYFHSALFSDGTCDSKIIGAVPISLSMACNIEDKRMNMGVDFTAIRRAVNDSVITGTVTVNATTDVWSMAAHGLVTGQEVRLSSTTTLPAGYAAATTYFVYVITDGTFKLYSTFAAATQGSTDQVDATDTGTGTHTLTAYVVSYPTQEPINPFHFTNSGAVLKITVGEGASATTYTTKWAGFDYGLTNAIAAEQRAGSNTFNRIEKVDRGQSLNLVLDYDDATFRNIIQSYQVTTSPLKLKVELTLRGKLIGQTDYFKLTGVFYNCYLGQQGYTTDANIGKQMLALSVNHDQVAGKSADWTIINDTASYLA